MTNPIGKRRIEGKYVPLFDLQDGLVTSMPYGGDGRLVLKRSAEKESMMRGLGKQLIKQHAESKVRP